MEKIIKNNNEEIVNKYLDNITKNMGMKLIIWKKIDDMEKIIKNNNKEIAELKLND